ncbi:uncharacterized protein LOC127263908 [Andrographis paniculata]|uniref:uncharacterized protein LOC127263908 n=1 Tax=Andrographis paniculata TaxID=175694 RepID=UPI0021E6E825|nr:uncharacterized protein LOC127263908 [Andrographis paniculata]
MPQRYFPLRWESTGGDQWWFASPIDWAAANGYYDLVRELLQADANLLIKLTSLPRIRWLETVWDSNDDDIARCRSQVAQKLVEDKGYKWLIEGGYGGWLLYTAASAGDLIFVKQVVDREPLLVFGEGEYGVCDIFYAAMRSRSSLVIRLLLDRAMSQLPDDDDGGRRDFKWDLMNRAVHAAARVGNVDMLREAHVQGLGYYKDGQGSTLLHTASATGQAKVVKYLISSCNDMICGVDDGGNTALHMAAFHGHLAVMKLLAFASPSSALMTNHNGDTLLHMAMAAFATPTFKRLDKQMELIKHLLVGNIINIIDVAKIINAANHQGRTALHMAVVAMPNIHPDIVELLLSAAVNINLNLPDAEGNTPLDLLKQRPRSTSGQILIKRLISVGMSSNSNSNCCQDSTAKNVVVPTGLSPGTSFRIADAELILHARLQEQNRRRMVASGEFSITEHALGEIESMESKQKGMNPLSSVARRLKILLGLPRPGNTADSQDDNYGSMKSNRMFSAAASSRNSPISLRQQFSSSRPSCSPSPTSSSTNQGILMLSLQGKGNLESPCSLTAGQVVLKSKLGLGMGSSPLSIYSEPEPCCLSLSSPMTMTAATDICCSSNQSPNPQVKRRRSRKQYCSLNLKYMMNKLF